MSFLMGTQLDLEAHSLGESWAVTSRSEVSEKTWPKLDLLMPHRCRPVAAT